MLKYIAEESILDDKNKVDYEKLKPVLFEMPNYSYLATGRVIAKGTSFFKQNKE